MVIANHRTQLVAVITIWYKSINNLFQVHVVRPTHKCSLSTPRWHWRGNQDRPNSTTHCCTLILYRNGWVQFSRHRTEVTQRTKQATTVSQWYTQKLASISAILYFFSVSLAFQRPRFHFNALTERGKHMAIASELLPRGRYRQVFNVKIGTHLLNGDKLIQFILLMV